MCRELQSTHINKAFEIYFESRLFYLTDKNILYDLFTQNESENEFALKMGFVQIFLAKSLLLSTYK